MTAYDTSANVILAVTDNGYTISATGSITDATFVRYLATADDQVTLDDPGFTQDQANEAVALLVCHRIARKLGKLGKTSENLGRGSYSKKLNGMTSWMDEYDDLIRRVAATVTSTTQGIQSLSTDGLTRDDANMNGLSLDQSTPYDLADEERDE